MSMQFDYVTGYVFIWTVGLGALICGSIFLLIAVWQHRSSEEINKKIEASHVELSTKIKAVEQLWLDSNGRKKIK